MAVLRGAVGRADAEDCFQETFLAALRAYPKLRRRRQPARLAADDRPPQGDRPPPRQRAPAGAGRRGGRGRGRATPSPTTGIWAAGRGAAAEAAGRGRPALRLRPPPRRDRRRARLLARGGAPQPARGNQATEKGAGMKDCAADRLAERAAEEGLLDVAYTTTDSPFGAAAARDDAARPGPGRPAEPGRRRAARGPGGAGLAAGARGPGPARRGPARARPLLRGQADRLRPAARLAAQQGLPPPGAAGDRPHPLRPDPQLHARWRAAPATSARSAPPARPAARNPIPIVVPCHRVLRTGGGLGGYGGGLPMKRGPARARGRAGRRAA